MFLYILPIYLVNDIAKNHYSLHIIIPYMVSAASQTLKSADPPCLQLPQTQIPPHLTTPQTQTQSNFHLSNMVPKYPLSFRHPTFSLGAAKSIPYLLA